MRLRFGNLLLLQLLLAAMTASEPALGIQARAEFDVAAGTSFGGLFEGSCESRAVQFLPYQSAPLEFAFDRGLWTQYSVEMNYTQTPNGQDPRRTQVHHTLSSVNVTLPRSEGALSFQGSGSAWAFAQAATVDFSGSSFSLSPPAAGFTAVYLYGEQPMGLDARRIDVPRNLRQFSVSGESMKFHGDAFLVIEEATLRTHDETLSTPIREQHSMLVGPAAVAQFGQMTISYATLELTNATIGFAPDAATVYCGKTSASLVGNLTAYRTTGKVVVGNESTEFDRAELSLAGSFAWNDGVESRGVRGYVEGDFTAVGFDFVDAGVVIEGSEPWLEIGFWSLLIATASTVVFFGLKFTVPLFTRLTESTIQGHTSRALVLDLVRQTPNINFHTLVASSKLNKSVVRYHVRVLEVGGFLRSHRVHRDRCFVSKDTIQKLGRAALAPSVDVLVRNDPVLGAILTGLPPGGIRMNQLLLRVCESMGVSRPGAWKAVLRAERKGQVRIERNGKEAWVHVVGSSTA